MKKKVVNAKIKRFFAKLPYFSEITKVFLKNPENSFHNPTGFVSLWHATTRKEKFCSPSGVASPCKDNGAASRSPFGLTSGREAGASPSHPALPLSLTLSAPLYADARKAAPGGQETKL